MRDVKQDVTRAGPSGQSYVDVGLLGDHQGLGGEDDMRTREHVGHHFGDGCSAHLAHVQHRGKTRVQ